MGFVAGVVVGAAEAGWWNYWWGGYGPYWGGQAFVGPEAGLANRPNIYNRLGNQANLASRGPGTRAAAQVRAGQNNIFAGKNGNVYRRTPQGWQERQGNSWSRPVGAGAARGTAFRSLANITRQFQGGSLRRGTQPRFNVGQLNREFFARQRGEMRTQNFQRARSFPAYRPSASFRPSGGGVSRPAGGGGGRRR